MTEPRMEDNPYFYKWYDVDTTKITSIKDVESVFCAIGLKIGENNENFDKVKHLLIIPEEPKTLEELSQELDEKIEKLIENFKEKSKQSKQHAEYRYNQFCEKQDGDFEYAKIQGYFPKLTIGTIGGTLDGSYLLANDFVSSNFVLKPDTIGVGYWEIQPNVQVWLKQKPTWIVRKCAKIFFDFTWKDT